MSQHENSSVFERIGGAISSALLTARRTFEFSGRSRRLEFGCYLLVTMIVTGLIALPMEWALGTRGVDMASVIVQPLLMLPLFALIVRRFHDMGWTGLWVIPVVPAAALGVYKSYWIHFAPSEIPFDGFAFGWAGFALGLAGAIVLFWALIQDGEDGPNRYGADPRLAPQADADRQAAVG